MPSPIFRARIQDGKLVLEHRDAYLAHLKSLDGAQDVEVIVRKRHPERTLDQNRYYWSVVVKVTADSLGYGDPQELHDTWKKMFLNSVSTTKLNTKQMGEYIDKCIHVAAEMGVVIPQAGAVEPDPEPES